MAAMRIDLGVEKARIAEKTRQLKVEKHTARVVVERIRRRKDEEIRAYRAQDMEEKKVEAYRAQAMEVRMFI